MIDIKKLYSQYTDLHIHTHYSDGKYSPLQILNIYKDKGIKTISITDHDRIDGIRTWREKCRDTDIELISGIEISSHFEDVELHILGYDIDIENENINKICEIMKADRQKVNDIIFNIIQNDFAIDKEMIKESKETDYIGKTDIARVLVSLGKFETIGDVFDKYFSKDIFENIKRNSLSADKTLKAIKLSGGFGVLAHPILIEGIGERNTREFYINLEKLLLELKTLGLMGMEVFYSKNKKEETEKLREMAMRLNLIMTRGSDFHQ